MASRPEDMNLQILDIIENMKYQGDNWNLVWNDGFAA